MSNCALRVFLTPISMLSKSMKTAILRRASAKTLLIPLLADGPTVHYGPKGPPTARSGRRGFDPTHGTLAVDRDGINLLEDVQAVHDAPEDRVLVVEVRRTPRTIKNDVVALAG